MKIVNKKIIVIVLCSILLCGICLSVWKIIDTQWERDFIVTYKQDPHQYDYKTYEITNRTNKSFESIYLVFEIKTWDGKKTLYEVYAFPLLEQGETETFKLYDSRVKEFLSEQNRLTLITSIRLIKIKHK